MTEVTPAELAEWLAELPKEARPKSTAGYALETIQNGAGWRLPQAGEDHYVYVGFPSALALWFTAATLWIWDKSHWIEPGGGSHYYVCWGRDENESHHITAASRYHALAAAVREVRGGGE